MMNSFYIPTLIHSSAMFIMAVTVGLPTTLTENALLNASDGLDDDGFGFSLSLDNDVLVAGTDGVDQGNETDVGAAYVFNYSMGAWNEEIRLDPPDPVEFGRFGKDVAIDGSTILIGASGSSGSVTIGGGVYVYQRIAPGNVMLEATLVSDDNVVGDGFERSVTIEGDLAVVGAAHKAFNGPNFGSAYVFRRDGAGVWTQESTLLPDDGHERHFFGFEVAISGDRAIVGGPDAITGPTGPGSAYIYRRDGPGQWVQEQKLIPINGELGGFFGHAVDIDCDFAIIGANRMDPGGHSEAGKAFIYRRDGLTWSLDVELAAPTPELGARFGDSVGIDGAIAVIGSIGADDASVQAGAVFMYRRTMAGKWQHIATLVKSNPSLFSTIGDEVSINGRFVAVGNRDDDTVVTNAGAVAMYDINAFICATDLNNDATVDTADLGLLIGAFGSVCP